MEWVNRMNDAIDYIEANLCGTIDGNELARIAACPEETFRRMFSQICGISVSEYIRRRKLTCAAHELQNSDIRILDLALKYGYESADAFRVAFLRLHGVTPSAARADSVLLTFYCRITLQLSIKGIDRMEYTIKKRDGFKVIGLRRITPYGGGTWALAKTAERLDEIQKICGKAYDLGLCFGFFDDGSNDYMCAVEWDGEDIPALDSYTYTSHTWIEFKACGKITENTLGEVWNRINNEFLPQSKYYKCAPTIERYVRWDTENDICNVEILLPVGVRER